MNRLVNLIEQLIDLKIVVHNCEDYTEASEFAEEQIDKTKIEIKHELIKLKGK